MVTKADEFRMITRVPSTVTITEPSVIIVYSILVFHHSCKLLQRTVSTNTTVNTEMSSESVKRALVIRDASLLSPIFYACCVSHTTRTWQVDGTLDGVTKPADHHCQPNVLSLSSTPVHIYVCHCNFATYKRCSSLWERMTDARTRCLHSSIMCLNIALHAFAHKSTVSFRNRTERHIDLTLVTDDCTQTYQWGVLPSTSRYIDNINLVPIHIKLGPTSLREHFSLCSFVRTHGTFFFIFKISDPSISRQSTSCDRRSNRDAHITHFVFSSNHHFSCFFILLHLSANATDCTMF